MDEAAAAPAPSNPASAPEPAPPTWKQRLAHPRTLKAIAAGLAVGAAGAGIGWWTWLKPQRDLAKFHETAMLDVTTLFGLQASYKRAKGVYANDLDSLLTVDPDAAALKASLAAHVDLTTLAVVGDAEKFKIEANVLDKDRTLIKIKGPLRTQHPNAAVPTLPIAQSAAPGDGAPVASPPAR